MSLQAKHESHSCQVCGETWVCSSLDCNEAQEAPCYSDTEGFGQDRYYPCLSVSEGKVLFGAPGQRYAAPSGVERNQEYP